MNMRKLPFVVILVVACRIAFVGQTLSPAVQAFVKVNAPVVEKRSPRAKIKAARPRIPQLTGHILVILHTGLLTAELPNLFFLVWDCRLSTIDVWL
jgi:hypothetical protein